MLEQKATQLFKRLYFQSRKMNKISVLIHDVNEQDFSFYYHGHLAELDGNPILHDQKDVWQCVCL